MRGRDEVYHEILEKTEKKIEGLPQYVTEYYLYLRQDKSARTISAYMLYLVRFLKFYAEEIGKEVTELTNEDIEKINTDIITRYVIEIREKNINRIDSLGKLSPSAQTSYGAAIGGFFRMLYARNHIKEDPYYGRIKNVKNRNTNDVVYLDDKELRKFLNNIDNDYYTGSSIDEVRHSHGPCHYVGWSSQRRIMMYIYLSTGIRKSAVTYMNMEDLHLDEGYFVATDKEDKTRKYFLPQYVIEYFEDWLKYRKEILGDQEIDAVFISLKRKRITPLSVDIIVKRYAEGVSDKHITAHKLRHTYGTNLYKMTKDIYRVADELGHSNLRNVQRYAAVSEKSKLESTQIIGNLLKNLPY